MTSKKKWKFNRKRANKEGGGTQIRKTKTNLAAKTGAAIRRGQVGEPTYILREILLICFVYQLVAMMKKNE